MGTLPADEADEQGPEPVQTQHTSVPAWPLL